MKLEATVPEQTTVDSRAEPCQQFEVDRKRAEEELRRSEEKYRDLIEISPDAIYVIDAEGICLLGNRAGAELAGIPEDELVGSPVTQTYLPEERHMLRQRIEKLRVEGTLRFERSFLRQNGDLVPVEVSLSAIRGGYYQAIVRDISERKQADILLAGEKRLLEMVAKGDPFSDVLDAICHLVEELCCGSLCSILLLDSNGNRLWHGAGPSIPKPYAEAIDGFVIGPFVGSCGAAAYRAEQVIVVDIATDPLWADFRDVALANDLRACWSTPILSSEGKVMGTFAMYYREPRSPTSQHRNVIDQITHLASIAIERKRAEEALHASEQLARGQVEALTYSLDVLATAPAPDKFLGQMLGTIGRLLKAQSVILWLLDEPNDSLVLRAWAEGANFEKADPEHPFIKNPLSWKEDPGLEEMFFSGAPVGCEDIEHDPRISSALREYLKSGGTRKFLRIPTLVGGRVKGFIGIRHEARPPYRQEEIELAQALAHQAMLAIQLNEFAEQSRQAAVLEERNRMARDIHDTLAQGFTGVIVQLEAAEDAIACCRRKEADEHLQQASELARRSLNEARRSVHALRPEALQRGNFWEALKGIIKNTTVGTAVHTSFELRGKLPELSEVWQENLMHIGQEALSNALKYAHARNFETRLSCNAKELRLELHDDGDGFKIKDQHDGFGLAGMRERVEQMGGKLKVASSHGKGTKIVVTLPYNHESIL
jgi:PAS domain S-box-containing protein